MTPLRTHVAAPAVLLTSADFPRKKGDGLEFLDYDGSLHGGRGREERRKPR